ncbi:HprK-related kinase A [Paraglaciecola sp.]|uniref:HprK-related kinase A n=1 Tax=Paraglaciecola sp. TaxID=1920173 RepID=UPI00273D180C|nr:HprK-related kinase A [Paraglaciecola sp.]MDP5031006.1 HprK-related kinase A [Paraglaciecola sp.]
MEWGEAKQILDSSGLVVDLGVAAFRVQSSIVNVQETFLKLYSSYELLDDSRGADFQVAVKRPLSVRRWLKPQVSFFQDNITPFLPLPFSQSYPLLEWGMNWCMASYMHEHLLIHGAVLERNGEAFIFPAPPGSGKSTLCAFLAFSGWRILSDEMTVLNLSTGEVHPFVRPICLKNNSINLFRSWFPEAFISPIAKDTAKGDVAHIRPPVDSINRIRESVKVRAVILPKYSPDIPLDIYSLSKCDALQSLSGNAFNEGVLGLEGFKALVRLVESVDTVEIHYNDLQEVSAFLLEGIFTP